MQSKELVIFDFDGVLVNTADLGFQVQKKYNPEITKDFFDSLNHGNFLENYEKAIAEGTLNNIPDWEEQYGIALKTIKTHDVLSALIKDLSSMYMLVIVSSSQSVHINNFLEQENLRKYFAEIYGSDIHKSKVVKINSLLKKYEIKSDDALFITDTLGDIREGKECNVNSIGVTWGVHGREILEQSRPFAVVDDVIELDTVIQKFFHVQKLN